METQETMRFMRWMLAWVTRLVVPALLVACPSSDADLGPIWIETSIAAADLDGDTRQDVVTVASYSRSYEDKDGILKVYLQTTAGSYAAPAEVVVGRYPWLVKIGDVDGDNAPDLVVLDVGGASGQTGVIYLLLQDRNNRGRFLAPQSIVTASTVFYDFALADLNADGALDIVLAAGIGGGNGEVEGVDPDQRLRHRLDVDGDQEEGGHHDHPQQHQALEPRLQAELEGHGRSDVLDSLVRPSRGSSGDGRQTGTVS